MPVSGWLSARGGSRRTRDRVRRLLRRVPLPALAPSFALLLPAALVIGAGNGSLDVAMNAHGVAVERRHESPILSSFHAAFSCGALDRRRRSARSPRAPTSTSAGTASASRPWRWSSGSSPRRWFLPADADHAGEEAGPLLAWPPRALWAVGAVGFCALVVEGATADWSASTCASRSTPRPASRRSPSRRSRRR